MFAIIIILAKGSSPRSVAICALVRLRVLNGKYMSSSVAESRVSSMRRSNSGVRAPFSLIASIMVSLRFARFLQDCPPDLPLCLLSLLKKKI